MKVTLTLEDTVEGVDVRWTEELSDVQNHAVDSLAAILTAKFIIEVNQQHRLGTLRLSGPALGAVGNT